VSRFEYATGGAPFNVASFTGRPDQITSDEYDFEARELHNGQGRWISPDPMRGTGNKYVYADNNPLSEIDLLGLVSMFADESEVAAGLEDETAQELLAAESAPAQPAQADGQTLSTSPNGGSPPPQSGTPTPGQTPAPTPQPSPSQQSNNQQSSPADQAQQTYGRQPDGSYVAPPSKTDPHTNPNGPPSTSIGNGQCVAATAALTGVTADTSQWTKGKPVVVDGAVDPSIRKGTAVATFDSNGRYYPNSSEKNSGTFMGGSTKGSFWLLDQWPARTDSSGNVIREDRPPGERPISPTGPWPSDNSNAYYVIIVPR